MERISWSLLEQFKTYLLQEERSTHTIDKYMRDISAFLTYSNEKMITKELIIKWKESLLQKYAVSSVNSMLAALNSFLCWAGMPIYKVKLIKVQRMLFRLPEKELQKEEYERLIAAAKYQNNKRLSLVLQTICATGIRISELHYITVNAICTGRAVVDCKGKQRVIFLPKMLCRSLTQYCREKKIRSGIIFCTKSGKPLNRSNVWRDMKKLCKCARVAPTKVFPHNLRHLFACTYYRLEKDLSKLADLLGHSNIATTRIYTTETGVEHIRPLEGMGLVLSY